VGNSRRNLKGQKLTVIDGASSILGNICFEDSSYFKRIFCPYSFFNNHRMGDHFMDLLSEDDKGEYD
jgi:hypothetical protein